jgi:hypothetical protein
MLPTQYHHHHRLRPLAVLSLQHLKGQWPPNQPIADPMHRLKIFILYSSPVGIMASLQIVHLPTQPQDIKTQVHQGLQDLATSPHRRGDLEVIVTQDSLLQPALSDGPRPRSSRFATVQGLGCRRFLQHAVLFHGLHLMAGGVGEEVLELLIFEGQSVP